MAARRPRKTDHGVQDYEKLLEAIKEVKVEKKSIRQTATKFGMDDRSLGRYIKKFDMKVPDIEAIDDEKALTLLPPISSYANTGLVHMIFDYEQEASLVDYLISCSLLYYGLSITEVKQLAYQFARKLELQYPLSWDEKEMAGKQWYYGFMLRHKNLSLRSPEQTSMSRTKAFCKENVDHFFSNLERVFAETPYGPSSIWNMDDTGFSTVPNRIGKVVSVKGQKRIGHITSGERGAMITLAFAVNAAGNTFPPFYLFPRKKMTPAYLKHSSKETVGHANGSGWMQQAEFVQFMKHFIKYTHSSKSTPTLLLLDNHASHLSVEAIDLAVDNGVTMLTFPPHCSHRLQPLDVAVYGPVKGAYIQQHNAWMRENAGRTLNIMHIPLLVKAALLKGATPENIVNGFKATGISPFNPGVFKDSDYISLGVDETNAEASAVEREFDEEEQRRIVVLSDELPVASNETVSTSDHLDSEPSTSGISRASSYASVISNIGHLKEAPPQEKSNRGRKAKSTSIITSPENLAALRQQQEKRDAAKAQKELGAEKRQQRASASKRKSPAKAKAPPQKRKKKRQSSSEDSDEFCLVCCEQMPPKITAKNSERCRSCRQFVHATCIEKTNTFYFCPNCDSGDESD